MNKINIINKDRYRIDKYHWKHNRINNNKKLLRLNNRNRIKIKNRDKINNKI